MEYFNVLQGKKMLAELLIANGADVQRVDDSGEKNLHW